MIKKCPICGYSGLEKEKAAEPVYMTVKIGEHWGTKHKLVDAVSYRCEDCGAEFIGISGQGVFITWNPKEERE